MQQWTERAHDSQLSSDLRHWMMEISQTDHPRYPLLRHVFGHSDYLSQLVIHYPQWLHGYIQEGADAIYAHSIASLRDAQWYYDTKALMHLLRHEKKRLALTVALADLDEAWELSQITRALSEFAQTSLTITIDSLLVQAVRRGQVILPNTHKPSKDSGIIILGMGKLGGYELNYSSDIDLIIFYEPEKLTYLGRQTEQRFMHKLAHDLVAVMHERTQHGYVFRTDLRLRPDPASTPPAINIDAAYYYYESVGQNWERAAMIKARPVAGDIAAAERFLKTLHPFMWRRNLDFASINDIHSLKRQMDSLNNAQISVAGHNVKLGVGGIREIEFYAQIFQLIWGGRETVLRTRATCETLEQLSAFGLVSHHDKTVLVTAYTFYRKLEHRLQMIADEQTHTIGETDEDVAHIASFMGFEHVDDFCSVLMGHVQLVHELYAASFRGVSDTESPILGESGNLVFTGTLHDPGTLKTLKRMGYRDAEKISATIMSWHHGSRRATRSKRARELLTELMPLILKRLSETVDADVAFANFDGFLSNLPTGVQLFSLFDVNPHLLNLISEIMGSAPALAHQLSKMPELLDAVVYGDFYQHLPEYADLKMQLDEYGSKTDDFETNLNQLRRFNSEKHFQAGVQLLKNMITRDEAGQFLSDLADISVQKALDMVMADFERTHGVITGARFAVLSLGGLGSQEMTFGSDIDLIFLYDTTDPDAISDGEKQHTASVYFNRMAQRLVSVISSMGREGRLYDVDTRLRPSGEQGMLAVHINSFEQYFRELAWTFEFMALVKGRACVGDQSLCVQIDQIREGILRQPRDKDMILTDAAHMRERVYEAHNTQNPWDVKHVRGGLIDLDFIAQSLCLTHAIALGTPLIRSTRDVLEALYEIGVLHEQQWVELDEAHNLLSNILSILRLCSMQPQQLQEDNRGLKDLLVKATGASNFNDLRSRMIHVEQVVMTQYIDLLNLPTLKG